MKHICIMLAILAMVGCQKKYKITEKARQQLPVSLDYFLSDFIPGHSIPEINHLSVVYENDTLALLQFRTSVKDSAGTEMAFDMRYVYLFDRRASYMEKRTVMNECFTRIPLLPDKKIKECRDSVRIKKENVYDSIYGMTLPVRVQ